MATASGSTTAPQASANGSPSTETALDGQSLDLIAPPGATVYPPLAAVSAASNPRSCVTCRRRKVRCDKFMPCGNCRRAQIQCVFPAPGRAPRRARPKDPNAPTKQRSSEREVELIGRLRKLEGIVEELSGQIQLEAVKHSSSSGNSPETSVGRDIDSHAGIAGPAEGSVSEDSRGHGSPAVSITGRVPPATGPLVSGYNTSHGPLGRSSDVNTKLGRLVVNEKGTGRYVSSGFWSRINDELDEIRAETQTVTEEESDESEAEDSPASVAQERSATAHQSFIMGYRSADVDLRPFHPLPSQIPFMWQIYQENVDPLVKILHAPSMDKLIREIRNNLDTLTPPTEALMFSIYYAAITSMDEAEVKLNFNAERDFLITQYRFALEQALAKANFLAEPDLTVCQAFLLFLVIVRRHDDTRFTWTLTGLIIRISQAMGLHRDGTNFPNITPFEIEMRRRLFWAICVLDLRSAEDQGTDLTVVDRAFDTQLPLNIDDADIGPDSKVLPNSREGHTDMTFSLVRYEICALARRLHVTASAMSMICPRDAGQSVEERETLLREVHGRIEDKYLKHGSSEDNPKYWVVANVARLIVAKMTLLIYQPVLFPGPGNEHLSRDRRHRLLTAAIEVFEYNHLLNTDPRTKQWRWLFQTYTQWHAVAYVLLELPHWPWCSTMERAWCALASSVFASPKAAEIKKMADNAAVWLPLRKLYYKAKRYREGELARLRSDPAAAQQLDLETRSNAPPPSFAAIPGSLRSAGAHERWRRLVNAPPPLPREPAVAQQQPDPQSRAHLPPTTPGAGEQNLDARGEEFIDEFMDATFSAPFVPTLLFPLAWSSGDPIDTDRQAVSGFPNGGVPRVNNLLASASSVSTSLEGSSTGSGPNYASIQSRSLLPQHHPQQQQHQAQQHQQQSPLKEDHRPAWLWPSDSGLALNRFPNTPAEDIDVNMEEGFDWQNWQESIRGFELETSGGGAGGVWGQGI